METIIPFEQVRLVDIGKVGGKNASLGEMLGHLTKLNIKVPEGFATTAAAYRKFLSQKNLDNKIYRLLASLDVKNIATLKKASKNIRQWIMAMPFDKKFEKDITDAFKKLKYRKNISVAVRSSATAEDLPEASFAGQQETILNVTNEKDLIHAVKKVFASLFTERAISYRAHHKIAHDKVAISVGIQKMIRSDKAASGVMFTIDTESGFNKVIIINANYGLGETVVQGAVNPDEFCVFKPMLMLGKKSILRRHLGDKSIKMIYGKKDGAFVKTVAVPIKDRMRFCLSDHEVELLAKQGLIIEKHYGMPMDVEWAKDGVDGEIYILQARPETVKSREKIMERFQLTGKGKIKVSGRSVGQKIGQGVARVIDDPKKLNSFHKDEVLVTDMTDPDWEPIMKLASAIVTNRGGRTCHAAIVARELGIPAVVGCGNATSVIKNGEEVTVSCAEGDIGYVYEGKIPFKAEKISVKDMPKLPFKICMNLGNPEKAFDYQFLPNDGVGLARLEFIIGNTIGVHPETLLKFKTLPKKIKTEISQKISGYSSPTEFYIQKLVEGIATIAAAFYPKEVIFRFSDFKSNEYANLLGGQLFEPKEENPMIGFRGAGRYVSEKFQDCFELECQAFKRVRDAMGLVNAQLMVPFVRTVAELKNVIGLAEKFGLRRGENDLKIYMMCEVPSNPLLAAEFLKYCDGFSIGSNDLTQLTLGLDRDSDLVASLFDERDLAVKHLLHLAISECNHLKKYVGICGQGPSDHPDLAQWLMEEKIQSISLSPDTIVETWLFLAEQQNKSQMKNSK